MRETAAPRRCRALRSTPPGSGGAQESKVAPWVGRALRGAAGPSFVAIKQFVDKGIRTWVKKGVGKVVRKSRDVEGWFADDDASETAEAPPMAPPHDPTLAMEPGMIDEIPLLAGD